jgi:hypothetical protein
VNQNECENAIIGVRELFGRLWAMNSQVPKSPVTDVFNTDSLVQRLTNRKMIVKLNGPLDYEAVIRLLVLQPFETQPVYAR